MAVKTVEESLCRRLLVKFANRQRVDIANAARAEIAGGCVVQRVRTPPAIIWSEGQDAKRSANPIIARPAGEEGSMTAIMLNDEQSEQQESRQWCQDKRGKIAGLDRDQNQREQAEEGNKGDREFPSASAWPRIPELVQLAYQLARIERCDVRFRLASSRRAKAIDGHWRRVSLIGAAIARHFSLGEVTVQADIQPALDCHANLGGYQK